MQRALHRALRPIGSPTACALALAPPRAALRGSVPVVLVRVQQRQAEAAPSESRRRRRGGGGGGAARCAARAADHRVRGDVRTTSAPGLRSPLPHLHQDWARPATSAPGLGSRLATSVQFRTRESSLPIAAATAEASARAESAESGARRRPRAGPLCRGTRVLGTRMDGSRRFGPQRAAEWAAVGFTDAPPLAVRAAPAAVTAPWDRAVLEAPAVVVDAHTCAKLSRRQLGALLAGGKVCRRVPPRATGRAAWPPCLPARALHARGHAPPMHAWLHHCCGTPSRGAPASAAIGGRRPLPSVALPYCASIPCQAPQSRRRCGGAEPSPGADVAAAPCAGGGVRRAAAVGEGRAGQRAAQPRPRVRGALWRRCCVPVAWLCAAAEARIGLSGNRPKRESAEAGIGSISTTPAGGWQPSRRARCDARSQRRARAHRPLRAPGTCPLG